MVLDDGDDDLEGLDFDSGGISDNDDYEVTTDSNNIEEPVDFADYRADDTNSPTDTKKIALFTIIIGVILLVIIGLFIGNRGNIGKQKVSQQKQQASTQAQQQQASTQVQQPTQAQQQQQQQTQQGTSWIELDKAERINYSSTIQGTMVIEELSHFALKNEDAIQLKSIAKGSIKGLIGEYEVEIPYYKGYKSVIGDTLRVTYMEGKLGDVKMVTHLSYKE